MRRQTVALIPGDGDGESLDERRIGEVASELAADLVENGRIRVTRAGWADLPGNTEAEAILVASRHRGNPSGEEARWLAEAVAGRPTWLVAFAQDAFLQDFSGAAGRISAGDPGPIMRAVVAETLFGQV